MLALAVPAAPVAPVVPVLMVLRVSARSVPRGTPAAMAVPVVRAVPRGPAACAAMVARAVPAVWVGVVVMGR